MLVARAVCGERSTGVAHTAHCPRHPHPRPRRHAGVRVRARGRRHHGRDHLLRRLSRRVRAARGHRHTPRRRLADAARLALLGAVPVALAWILCRVQRARARRWGVLAALALALPLVTILGLAVLDTSTSGHLLPAAWATHNAGRDARFQRSLLL